MALRLLVIYHSLFFVIRKSPIYFSYSAVMKQIYTLFVASLFVSIATLPAYAQPETSGMGQDHRARDGQKAISQAVINTVMPVATGYGAVKLFDGNTVETIGATLAVYGLIIGPSTGNFYANDYLRGGLGALTRLGAAYMLQNATSEVFGREFADVLRVDDKSVSLGDADIIVGSALMLGTIAYNIFSAPVSVREYNRSMGYAVEIESLKGTGRSAPVLTARINF